jgi:hypothetical protein
MPYIVVAESDGKKRHLTKADALKEAERLCKKEGKMIEVYKSIGEVSLTSPPVEFHEHHDAAGE